MKHSARRVLEVVIDELARAFGLGPEAVDQCRRSLAEQLRPRWPVLFMATGDRPPCQATIHAFRTLAALGVEPTLLRSHSFSLLWSAQTVGAQLGNLSLLDSLDAGSFAELPERFPLLCILTLSDNTVSKAALGLRDAVPPQVLRAFLDRGRPVLAAGMPPQKSAPSDDEAKYWNLPRPLRQWMSDGHRTLEQWGVEFVDPVELPRAVRRYLFGLPANERPSASPAKAASASGRAFITVDDVLAARMRGEKRMNVPAGAIVTDEARDYASRHGIQLVE